MDKYFGIFLCAYGWQNSHVAADLIRESIGIVKPQGALMISGRRPTEANILKPSIQGDFSEYSGRLEQFSDATYIIANRLYSKGETEIDVCFEGQGGEYRYAHKSYSESQDSVLAFEAQPGALVTLSVSVRHDVWAGLRKRGGDAELMKSVETAFVSLGATYGYGHPIPLPLSGRFSLIWGNATKSYPRIMDFDYRRYVERICEMNLFSSEQIRGRGLYEKLKAIEGVEVKRLGSSEGASKGLAVYLTDFQKGVDLVRAACGDLVWSPANPMQA